MEVVINLKLFKYVFLNLLKQPALSQGAVTLGKFHGQKRSIVNSVLVNEAQLTQVTVRVGSINYVHRWWLIDMTMLSQHRYPLPQSTASQQRVRKEKMTEPLKGINTRWEENIYFFFFQFYHWVIILYIKLQAWGSFHFQDSQSYVLCLYYRAAVLTTHFTRLDACQWCSGYVNHSSSSVISPYSVYVVSEILSSVM